ncbi:MAG: hypothetical protein GY866_26315, partial [Proteobacteria bacterium]|nr:hypothetical protein [Pseudomonadota bacterium]
MLLEEFDCEVDLSTVSRALTRIAPDREPRVGGRPKTKKRNTTQNVLGGFELIIALAYYLEWPRKTADVICGAVDALKKSDAFETGCDDRDRKGRSKSGYFTKRYNQRKEVR